VTRAKTALSVYHCNGLHGYFEAALQSVKPVPKPPSLEDLYNGPRKLDHGISKLWEREGLKREE
jgi:hypothetical protein